MKRRVLALLAAVALLCVIVPATGYAQESTIVTVGFPFIAGEKTMPAGQYDLRLNNDWSAFVLTALPKGTGMFLAVITRLAAPEVALVDAHVVFDKVGNTYYLSEVWLPGEDGFLLYAAKEKHTHTTVKFNKKGL